MSFLKTTKALLVASVTAVFIAACGGGGGGDDGGSSTPSTPTTGTTISGKVTLSSTLTSTKPSQKMQAMTTMPKGKPGSKAYKASRKAVSTLPALPAFATTVDLACARVSLYDADHPEWTAPVAWENTDDSGNYTLNVLKNASSNNNAYTDGNPIPIGKYTLMATKTIDCVTGFPLVEPVVAIQTVVKDFSGAVTGNDLDAQPSDVVPTVETMFGVERNTDGTDTWGGASVVRAPNAAIQVTYSMAMRRDLMEAGIAISPAVSGGYWAVSSDWLSATYYLPAGTTLTAGQTYTVTVQGGDTNADAVRNVYGNAIAANRVGTFTVAASTDTQAPTAIQHNPPFGSSGDFPITDPIRIASDEVLDINGLTLTGDPSVGSRPGVLYLGQDTASGNYIYEFILGDPLKVGTSYSLTVSGGKDLAGNTMNTLNFSLSTESTTLGVDDTADTTTQTAQAEVKDSFGKWVRAFNDRSLTQLQAMMTGGFVFEYNVNVDGIDHSDANRDGRLSLLEFSNMISEAFLHWEGCGTTMSGDLEESTPPAPASPYYINVVGDVADFKFSLSASSTNTSSMCQDAAPDDYLYATVKKVNGAWLLSRVSEGVDTRGTELVTHSVLSLTAPTHGFEIPAASIPSRDASGIVSNPVTFSWDPVTDATAYLFIIINNEDDWRGRAMVLPSSMTSLDYPLDVDPLDTNSCGLPKGIAPFGTVKANNLFDFDTCQGIGMLKAGEEFIWEVIALGSLVPGDFDTDGNQNYEEANSRVAGLWQDVIAVSKLFRYKNEGTLQRLSFSVEDTVGNPLTFSELYEGYDAGALDQLAITVTTPNAADAIANNNGWLYVNGHSWQDYPLTWVDNFDGTASATVTVDLFQGWNWIDMNDGVDLWEGFSAQTTGGLTPVINIDTALDPSDSVIRAYVTDNNSNQQFLDDWGFVDTTGDSVNSITVTGTVTDPTITQLNVNLWNDSGANEYTMISVSGGTFSFTMPVYNGHNWFNIADDMWTYQAHFGVYTDAGTTWVPPITISAVTTATKTGDFGNSSDWDASSDADDIVTITGNMVYDTGMYTPWYNINSEGSWKDGELTVAPDGSFSLSVTLYNGWNWVNFNDAEGNWYGVNIYTSNGLVVVKPQIVTVYDSDGSTVITPDASGVYTVTGCQISVDATSLPLSDVNINWNGDDGAGNYAWESYTLQTGGAGAFSISSPIVGSIGSGWNNIDIYDTNWNWTGMQVKTSGSCPYIPPVLTVDSAEDSLGNPLVPDMYGDLDAGTSPTVTVFGTSTDPGRRITAEVWSCNGSQLYETTSSLTQNASLTYDWSITGNVYDGWNSVDVTDGVNWEYAGVYTTNGIQPPSAFSGIAVSPATKNYDGCGYSDWDAGAATTVTISGNTTAADGTGEYWAADGSYNTFPIASGAFSFTVNVFDGWNNISFNDSDWNHYNVSVSTTNGIPRPQYVIIQSPAHNATSLANTVAVSGIIDDNGTGYAPNILRASVYAEDDTGMGNWTYYSSDSWDQSYGDSPLTYDAVAGTFSFSANLSATANYARIEVYGYDDTLMVDHGHSIEVNAGGYGYEYNWKPANPAAVRVKEASFKAHASKARHRHDNKQQ